ncbi:MAG: hypothetical protein ABI823_17150 [Bryobacteraceae bacterium]
MANPSILVELPADRSKLGRISLRDANGALWGPAACYGKADAQSASAHGNPQRDPLQPFGDTPLGSYACAIGRPAVTPRISRSYGPNGYVVLRAVSGPAKTAEQNGRFGLLIHGGDLNAAGKLRPTFGCVRVGNEDLKALLAKIEPLVRSGLQCEIVER